MSNNKFSLLDPEYIEKINLEIKNSVGVDDQVEEKKTVDKKSRLTYDDKINIISKYFGVSNTCAKYLFHRRYRGYPFHRRDHPKYLAWSIALQNAIILLDTLVGFDWDTLEFGYEEIIFNKYDINIVYIEDDPIRLVEETEDNEWSEINNNHIIYELTKMGLLPKSYRDIKPNKNK